MTNPALQRLEEEKALFDSCSFYDGSTWSRSHYWKNPLRVIVDAHEVEAMRSAILGFVGGIDREEKLSNGQVLFTSKGYYHYIGA